MIGGIVRNGKTHVLELSNRANIQKLNATDFNALSARLDNHESSTNANAHQLSNVVGLVDALNSKQDTISGFTGSVTVVESVDFVAQTVVEKTLVFDNGVLINVT